jgi:hypothetical protein
MSSLNNPEHAFINFRGAMHEHTAVLELGKQMVSPEALAEDLSKRKTFGLIKKILLKTTNELERDLKADQKTKRLNIGFVGLCQKHLAIANSLIKRIENILAPSETVENPEE